MTRHELKEQLQHDQFTDTVSNAVNYASSHRPMLIKVGIGALVAVLLGVGIWLYMSSQREARQTELSAAMSILDAPVGTPAPNGKTYATEQAKKDAWEKALSDVANKYSGSNEGLIAQYYRGSARAQRDDMAGAEADFRAVSSGSGTVSPLAKIALAQIYLGQKKNSDARALLQELVNSPTALVSKAQAQILLAQLNSDPQAAKAELKAIDADDQKRAAVKDATDQLSTTLAK